MTELDGFLGPREVERLTGFSRRWLSVKIARGQFPPPDVRAPVRGASNKWRVSTIKSALDAMQANAQRDQPA